jgi:hypothetical protein
VAAPEATSDRPEAGASPAQTPRRARRRTIALVATGVLALTLALTVAAGSTPTACRACHAPQAEALAATAHTGVGCYTCHLDNGAWSYPAHKTRELFGMYPAALLTRGMRSPANAVARAVCLGCHEEIVGSVVRGRSYAIAHDSCATGPTCDACHATTAHGEAVRFKRGPVMEECVSCHSGKGLPIDCETCHLENADEEALARTYGPWQVTHGPNWRKTHGLGDTDSCVTCHPKGYCTRCHGVALPHPADFGATHGLAAVEKPDACATCHADRTAFCDACHTIEMPHPEGFIAEHPRIAKSDADPTCLHCHADNDCGLCHSAHVHPGGAKGVPVPWTLTPEERRP